MITLTKEWLLTTIAELEEERDAVPGAVNEDALMALAAMNIALASLEAESVAFRSKLKPPSSIGSEHWDYTDHRQPDAFELESCVIERLFTEPPAPVAVPDELSREDYKRRFMEEDNFDDTFRGGWNACRAAMLHGADDNSPVIPDGWVACSERMPEDTQMVLAFSYGEIVAAYWNYVMCPIEYKKYRAFTYLSGSLLKGVTHWMPLPAAPQQEVK